MRKQRLALLSGPVAVASSISSLGPDGLQSELIGYEMTTCTIEKAASEHRWEDAVLSLCNALDALPPQRRLALAREVLDLCESAKALLTSVSAVPEGERANRQGLQLQSVRLIDLGRVPGGGVGAVGKWPAGATAESLAEAGYLSTAVATAVLLGRVGLRHATLTWRPPR